MSKARDPRRDRALGRTRKKIQAAHGGGAELAISQDPWALVNETVAAMLLGLSVSILQSWRVSGRGPDFVKLSRGAIRYRRGDLITYISARTVSSTSQVLPESVV